MNQLPEEGKIKRNSFSVSFSKNRQKDLETVGEAYESFTDEELWGAFKKGDEQAFVFIYKKYFSALYRYGSQFTKDRDLIKDNVQDLFVVIRERRDKLADTTSIKFYLFRSLKNNIVASLKKHQRFSYCEDFSNGFDFLFTFSIEHAIVYRQLDEEKKQMLDMAIKSLTSRQREVIYYFFYEGLSYEEIKDLMNMDHLKSVQNLLYKSIAILKEQLPHGFLILLFSRFPFV